MIQLHLLLSLILPILCLLIQNTNGLYVPRIYGTINYKKCRFTSETGEKHQIYKLGNIFMFGRVFLLEAKIAQKLHGNGNCPDMEKLETTGPHIHGNQQQQVMLRVAGQSDHDEAARLPVFLEKGENGGCRIRNGTNLELPVYSCYLMSWTLVQPNPCPPKHVFYLEETMDSETMPKVMVFKFSDDQIDFCKPIEPTGLSFVRKTQMQKLGIGNSNVHLDTIPAGHQEMPASTAAERQTSNRPMERGTEQMIDEQLLDAEAQVDLYEHRSWTKDRIDYIQWNKLAYKGLSLLVNRIKCGNIKLNPNNSVTPELRNTGFQMKLVCEDMMGIMVQISKGNLKNRELKFGDLKIKMEKTIEKLKKLYEKTLGTEGGEQASMPESSFKDVLKNMKESINKMRLELIGHELTDATMRKRFQTFARMLLYFLEKIKRYFYHEADYTSHLYAVLWGAFVLLLVAALVVLFMTPPGWILALMIFGGFISGILMTVVVSKATTEIIHHQIKSERLQQDGQNHGETPTAGWKRFLPWNWKIGNRGNARNRANISELGGERDGGGGGGGGGHGGRDGGVGGGGAGGGEESAIHAHSHGLFGRREQEQAYRALIVEEIYKQQTDNVAIVDKPSSSSSIAAKHKKNEGDVCAICLGEFADGDLVKRVPSCNHIFHSDCIDPWATVHFTCPLCRQNLLAVIDKRS